MSFLDVIHRSEHLLVPAFRGAIALGFLSAWQALHARRTAPEEPDYIAGLVSAGMPVIYNALRANLRPHGVHVACSAVFCHQSPKVDFIDKATKGCELGDILFAHVHRSGKGPPRRSALLLQAKKAKGNIGRVGAKDAQLRLYTDWPEFVYTAHSHAMGVRRHVSPAVPHRGAQYLLIRHHPPHDVRSGLLGVPGNSPADCCLPDTILHPHAELAVELFELIALRSGRPFLQMAEAVPENGWSQVVWDILENGLNRLYNRRAGGWTDRPRLVGDPLPRFDGEGSALATDPKTAGTVQEILGPERTGRLLSMREQGDWDRDDEDCHEGNEGGGVSFLLIETHEGESAA